MHVRVCVLKGKSANPANLIDPKLIDCFQVSLYLGVGQLPPLVLQPQPSLKLIPDLFRKAALVHVEESQHCCNNCFALFPPK